MILLLLMQERLYLFRGNLHHIENIYEGETKLAIAFNHERPEDVGISGSFGAYSNEILASVFKVQPTTLLDSLSKYQEDLFIVAGAGGAA
jgi:oxalate decarboxylase